MRKIEKLALALCCLALAALMAVGAWSVIEKGTSYNQYRSVRSAFGYLRYETLAFAPDKKKDAEAFEEEKEAAGSALEVVRNAVAYNGARSACTIEAPLNTLCRFTDDVAYTQVESDVTFLAYREVLGHGYLWVSVDQSCTDASGNELAGYDKALCLVEITPADNGTFTVDDVVIAEKE